MRSFLLLMVVVVSLVAVAPASSNSSTITDQKTSNCPAKAISWKTARNYVGRTVTIQGPLVSVFYAKTSSGQPTFINVGADYPNRKRVTGLVWGRNRSSAINFEIRKLQLLARLSKLGRPIIICLTGKVVLYRGTIEIEITNPKQIGIKQ